MLNYMSFWFSKIMVDLLVAAGIGLAVMIVMLILYLPEWYKQKRCNHDGGFNETMSCDAICRKCGKNLGFIGSAREKYNQK